MADPLSIAASCIAVMTAVGQTTRLVRDIVRTYRSARTDLVRLSQEISGLDLILQSLHDIVSDGTGIAGVPPQVLEQLDTIIRDCGSILDNIQAVLDGFVGTWAETNWVLTGKRKIADQLALLEVNRKALDLALSTIDFSLSQSIKQDTTVIREDTTSNKEKLDAILRHLKAAIPETGDDNDGRSEAETVAGKLDLMSRFLGSLGTYATSVCEEIAETSPQEPGTWTPSTQSSVSTISLLPSTHIRGYGLGIHASNLPATDWNKLAYDPPLHQQVTNTHPDKTCYSRLRDEFTLAEIQRAVNLNRNKQVLG